MKIFFKMMSSAGVFSIAQFVFISSVQAVSMTPGLWKTTINVKLNGLPLPPSQSEECLSASETKDVKTTITKELKKKGCVLTKWNLKANQLNAALACKNEDLEANGKIQGSVTEKSYSLVGDAKGMYKNTLPSQATLSFKGEWDKSCSP